MVVVGAGKRAHRVLVGSRSESGRELGGDPRFLYYLEALLDQTTMYSNFLAEQMEGIDEDDRRPKKKVKKAQEKVSEPASADGEVSETKKLLPMMNVEMRDYQLKGVRWLIALYQNGLNGILADQMGLGKTVQTIGFLSHLRHKGVLGPYLVLGPLSTLPNWVNEFNRFCPDFPVVLYHGNKQERAEIRMRQLPTTTPIKPSFPVIVTSFEIVMADRKFLQKYNFKYLVVDEGHRLKNFDCKLIRELKSIPTANKLLLTGTPLQNNLVEYYHMVDFVHPGKLGDVRTFKELYVEHINRGAEKLEDPNDDGVNRRRRKKMDKRVWTLAKRLDSLVQRRGVNLDAR